MSEVKIVDIKGLLDTYEFPYTLPGSGKELLIRPITTGQMKKVLAYEDETSFYVVEEALDRLITGCVVNDDFDMDDLYLQDRFSLMVEIRRVTKGDIYEFNYKCAECGFENITHINLSELNVKPCNPENNVIEINERLKFEVDYPTRRGQKDSIKRMKEKKLGKREMMVEVQSGTFANSIIKVHTDEGELDGVSFEDKLYILDNVSSDVFEKFTQWFVDYDFGVDFDKELQCVSCHHDDKIEIPLSNFFV